MMAGLFTRILRAWLYFRTGYGLYISLFLGVLSSAVTVYYLMVENIPALKTVFPTFEAFIMVGGLVFLPTCVTIGWAHYKKILAFSVDVQVQAESTPYLVDSRALYPALMCLATAQGLGDRPELEKLRALVEAMKK